MFPAAEAQIISNRVNLVGQALFEYFAQHVDPIIQSAAMRGDSSTDLVQVTAMTTNFAAISNALTQLGYTVTQHSDPSPSAQHLIVSW